MALEVEIKTYLDKKAALLDHSRGKFVLIKGEEVIGTFNTVEEALATGARTFGLDDFLVRPIQPIPDEVNIPALTLGLINACTSLSD